MHTVFRLIWPDNSAMNPTPHESLSNEGLYKPRGFSGTWDNADRTTTLSFGSRQKGPWDCQKCSLLSETLPQKLFSQPLRLLAAPIRLEGNWLLTRGFVTEGNKAEFVRTWRGELEDTDIVDHISETQNNGYLMKSCWRTSRVEQNRIFQGSLTIGNRAGKFPTSHFLNLFFGVFCWFETSNLTLQSWKFPSDGTISFSVFFFSPLILNSQVSVDYRANPFPLTRWDSESGESD